MIGVEQAQGLENEIEGVRGEIGVVRDRFDRHLEIYAANGKEMKRMADLLGGMMDRFDKFEKRTDPIVEVYRGVLTVKSIVIGFSSVIIALGAIGVGVVWFINQSVEK